MPLLAAETLLGYVIDKRGNLGKNDTGTTYDPVRNLR